MDEVLFHISQKLEALQVHLYSGAQHGRVLLHTYSEQAHELALSVWTGPRGVQLQEGLARLLDWLVEASDEARQVSLASLHRCYARLVTHLTQDMTRTSLYFGCVGFVVGGVVGITFGLSWHKSPPTIQRMKAVVCTSYRGIDALCMVDDLPAPVISSPDEVLIQVKAASVDPIDIKICSGYARALRKQLNRYNSNVLSELPVVLGRDCAGVVLEVGHRVSRVEPGDEVWLSVPHWAPGTIAELLVVKEAVVAKKPRAVGFETAASLPFAGTVAWHAMVVRAGLNSKTTQGKRILVHNACSPVGCILLQLARLWGATLTATCHMRATPVAQALGADKVLAFETDDLERQLGAMERFHVVFNTMGTVAHDHCLQFCHRDGMVVTTIAPAVASDTYGFLLGSLYALWIRIKCSTMGMVGCSSTWGCVHPTPQVLDTLCHLIEDGSLQPVVDKIYAPQDCELAFQHVDSAEAIGKTIIRFRSRNFSKSRSNSQSKRFLDGTPSM